MRRLRTKTFGRTSPQRILRRLPLARRFSEHEFKPDYTEKQVVQITTALTTLILMLAIYFLTVQGQEFIDAANAVLVIDERATASNIAVGVRFSPIDMD